MSIPAVGVIVALAYVAVIDNPERFRHSSTVGAYLGLTPRRYQSGEVDCAGHISKCGDGLLRSYLFQAANAILTRKVTDSTLRSWGRAMVVRTSSREMLRVLTHCSGHDIGISGTLATPCDRALLINHTDRRQLLRNIQTNVVGRFHGGSSGRYAAGRLIPAAITPCPGRFRQRRRAQSGSRLAAGHRRSRRRSGLDAGEHGGSVIEAGV
jgi:Transposase IS116/IS110/IS902 family